MDIPEVRIGDDIFQFIVINWSAIPTLSNRRFSFSRICSNADEFLGLPGNNHLKPTPKLSLDSSQPVIPVAKKSGFA